MDRLLRADLTTGDLDRPVGYDLVGVHVRLRARPGLPHDQGELVVELALDHLVGGLHYEVDLLSRELAQLAVRLSGCLLQKPECPDDPPLPHEAATTDREVLYGALGLGSPQPVGGHLHGPETVLVHPEVAAAHDSIFADAKTAGLTPAEERLSLDCPRRPGRRRASA